MVEIERRADLGCEPSEGQTKKKSHQCPYNFFLAYIFRIVHSDPQNFAASAALLRSVAFTVA